jgi:hypothetical protein
MVYIKLNIENFSFKNILFNKELLLPENIYFQLEKYIINTLSTK